MPKTLTREQMAEFLGIQGTKRCEEILNALTPAEWKRHEEFSSLVDQVMAYDRGEGPRPPGVIVCRRPVRRWRRRNA